MHRSASSFSVHLRWKGGITPLMTIFSHLYLSTPNLPSFGTSYQWRRTVTSETEIEDIGLANDEIFIAISSFTIKKHYPCLLLQLCNICFLYRELGFHKHIVLYDIFSSCHHKQQKMFQCASLGQSFYSLLMVTLDVICFVWFCMKKGSKCNHQSSQDWNDLWVAWASRIEPNG